MVVERHVDEGFGPLAMLVGEGDEDLQLVTCSFAARQEMVGELMEAHVRHAVLWQDADEDGAISLAELLRSTRRWHASLSQPRPRS